MMVYNEEEVMRKARAGLYGTHARTRLPLRPAGVADVTELRRLTSKIL
jgi:hypothetical protein